MGRRLPRELAVEVESLTGRGFGVGVDGLRRVEVKGALPGEAAVTRVLKKRRGVIYGEVMSWEHGHADRVAPACRHYPRCGGCTLQHLAYPAQLEYKQQVVRRLLARHDLLPDRWQAPVSGHRLLYRRKARLGVRCSGERVFVGFRESFNNRIVPLGRCLTLDPRLSDTAAHLAKVIAGLTCPDRVPQVELVAGDTSGAATLRHLVPLTDVDLGLLAEFGAAHRVEVLLQPGGYDTVRRLDGATEEFVLSYGLAEFGVCLQFPPTAFIQVNQSVNERLVSHVVRALGVRPGDSVTDMFCGIGNFSLALASRGVRVHGLELSGDAVAWARRNAALNGMRRCRFDTVDLYGPSAADPACVAADAWVLDPPRSGAGPHLASWLDAEPNRIVYVSCNPETFVLDGVCMRNRGYTLRSLTLYDMFPHTGHIELLGEWAHG